MIYLDNASTTWVYPECIAAIDITLMNTWGNPSNKYSLGDEPKQILKEAKEKLAKCINCDPDEIFFTSGASEGNAWASRQGNVVVCSPYEHHNYTDHPNAFSVTEDYLTMCAMNNIGDAQAVYHEMFPHYIYSHMLVSNITGEIFNVNKQFNIAHKYDMFCVCDCTQAFSNIEIDIREIDCDMATFSGHKFHAPKGVGFVYIRKDIQDRIKPLISGTQQNGLRGGTENTAYIKALGIAAEKAIEEMREKNEKSKKFSMITAQMLEESEIDFLPISGNNSIDGTYSFCLKNIESEIIQEMLNAKDIFIGTGSGCADGSMERDATLVYMNIPDEYIGGLIRLSFSISNTEDEVREAIGELIKCYKDLTK